MLKIIQNGDTILRGTAQDVPIEKIGTIEINTVISNMSKMLATQKDGVAIAAPQIGVPLRIFVVSGKVFDLEEKEGEEIQSSFEDLVFINPVITKMSKDKDSQEEGCLSVRGKYGFVNRAVKTTVRAYNENGKVFERGGAGLLSKIFQHEVDHLNGVLFIDKVENLYDRD